MMINGGVSTLRRSVDKRGQPGACEEAGVATGWPRTTLRGQGVSYCGVMGFSLKCPLSTLYIPYTVKIKESLMYICISYVYLYKSTE